MTTDITVLLDASGSMNAIKADTIGGYNEFLTAQQQQPDPATWTLATFNSLYGLQAGATQSLAETPLLTPATFQPGGGTPLYDALCHLIDQTGTRLAALPESDRPSVVLFVILTDGEENQSRLFTYEDVKTRITHQTEVYQWDFIYLGANQDALAAAARIGIPWMAAATFTPSAAGIGATVGATRRLVSAARSGQRVNRGGYTDAERVAMGSTQGRKPS